MDPATIDPLGLHRRRPGRPGLPGGSRRVTFVLDEPTYQLLEEAAEGRPVGEVLREVVRRGLAAPRRGR